jgi:hypothetical protein
MTTSSGGGSAFGRGESHPVAVAVRQSPSAWRCGRSGKLDGIEQLPLGAEEQDEARLRCEDRRELRGIQNQKLLRRQAAAERERGARPGRRRAFRVPRTPPQHEPAEVDGARAAVVELNEGAVRGSGELVEAEVEVGRALGS